MTKVIEPTPSQAAVVLMRFLATQGIEVPLSTVQEGLARAKGFASFNAYVHAVPHRGETPPAPDAVEADFSPFEGWEYWNVSGRVPFDDDDTSLLLWVKPDESETWLFKHILADQAGVDLGDEESEESEEFEVYICSSTRIGTVQGGKFVFDADMLPVKPA